MLIPYASMLLILIGLAFYIKKLYDYVRILKINLDMAHDPQIKAKLNNQSCNKTINVAITEYEFTATWLFYPLIAVFANVLLMCGLIALNIPLTTTYMILSVIFTADILTKTILLNTYPKWLLDWTCLLYTSPSPRD